MANEGRLLCNWIDAYMDYTYNSEPPNSYKKWSAISTVAACLQRKCSLQWGGTLYPNLYIVLVGPSGTRKTTAMKPAQSLLRKVGVKMSPEAVTREQLIRRLRKAGESEVSETGNIVMHASLTIFSKELTVFIGYNNPTLISDLCDWYDCDDKWSYETKNMGTDDITNVWVNLIGGTTPRLLQATLTQVATGGGLTSRIIFVYEQYKGKIVVTPFMTEKEVGLEENLIHDLEAIRMMHGEFKPDESFISRWSDWYSIQGNNPPFHDPYLDDYLTRRGTHVLKLSMVFNASRTIDMVLTSEDFDRALKELMVVEKKMPMTFRGIGKNPDVDVTDRVMTTIALRGEIPFDSLLGIHYADADRDTLWRIVNTLMSLKLSDGSKFCKWKGDSITTKIIVYIPQDK